MPDLNFKYIKNMFNIRFFILTIVDKTGITTDCVI